MVRDFSRYALDLYSKSAATQPQQEACLKMIKKPVADAEKFERVLKEHVYSLIDTYEMNQ